MLRKQTQDLEKEEKLRAQYLKEATDAASNAEQIYYQALKAIPTSWDAIGKDFVRSIGKLVVTVAGAVADAIPGILGGSGSRSSSTSGAMRSSDNTGDRAPPSFGLGQTVATANNFYESLQLFQQVISNKTIDPDKLTGLSIDFKAHRDLVEGLPNNAAKARVIRLMKRAERLAKNAAADAKQIKSSKKNDNAVTREIKDIFKQLRPFLSANQKIDEKAASNNIANAGKGVGHAADSSQNELFIAQLAQNQLTEKRRRQNEQIAEHFKFIENMRNTSAKLMLIDLTTVHYKEIIVMLNESIYLLGKVHKQWNDFVLFFTEMAVHIENMIKNHLKRFLQGADGAEEQYATRLILISLLKEETYGIHVEAYILYVMSRTYYEVSSKYLMGRLASLSGMIVARSETERKSLRESLKNQTDETLEQIKALILERNETFDKELNIRHTELTEVIDQLGGPNEDDQRAIKEGEALLRKDNVWGDR